MSLSNKYERLLRELGEKYNEKRYDIELKHEENLLALNEWYENEVDKLGGQAEDALDRELDS